VEPLIIIPSHSDDSAAADDNGDDDLVNIKGLCIHLPKPASVGFFFIRLAGGGGGI